MNGAAHTISLISPSKSWKSSSSYNMSNSDPTSFILQWCKWAWNSFWECNGTRPYGPVAIHSTPRNFRTSARKFWLNGLCPRSSSLALCCLLSVKSKNMTYIFFCSMYNKTIIRFSFCDIQNNQGLGRVISRSRLPLPWLFGYHKNFIQ